MAKEKLHIYLKVCSPLVNGYILIYRYLKRHLRFIDQGTRTNPVSVRWTASIRVVIVAWLSVFLAVPVLAEPQVTHPHLRMSDASTVAVKNDAMYGLSSTPVVRPIQPPPQALIFISFSMPDGLIQSILRDATRFHLPVVIRGLIDNDFKQTMNRLFLLEKKTPHAILINPLWFRTFQITRVPALVLTAQDNACLAGTSCDSNQFEVFYGSVSILEKLQQLANTSTIASQTAKIILNDAGEVWS